MNIKTSLRLLREKLKIAGVQLPRIALFDLFKVEQTLENLCQVDELPISPKTLKLLTSNVISRVYSRQMVHDSYKWVIWPEVPSDSYFFNRNEITVDPGETKTALEYWGRGKFVWVGFLFRATEVRLFFDRDGQRVFNYNMLQLYDALHSGVGTPIGAITDWDDANTIYKLVITLPLKFAHHFKISMQNEGAAATIVTFVAGLIELYETSCRKSARYSEAWGGHTVPPPPDPPGEHPPQPPPT